MAIYRGVRPQGCLEIRGGEKWPTGVDGCNGH
jgi:hypothetical protein